MSEASVPIIDATVFMGMHHSDPDIHAKSLGFFKQFYQRQALMSFGQIGICDAIIWKKSRELQDLYYPFMDVLHTEMNIQRQGYCNKVLRRACLEADWAHLNVEQKLLAAQVVEHRQPLYTHDQALHQLTALKPFLQSFPQWTSGAAFPPSLQALFEQSRDMLIEQEDFRNVS
ncbi:DUF6190 family protein [Pseudomonas prosekii]|uniref:PIN domain-containing protein n=1 Tax=Pseudomonas prosekii TaxID=1148509 RepID=A0A1H1Z0S2_9PSED|nr:DUF6190 family protein [Pseudomonas prosekii]SDT27223.1 hypothetical protein SAMN05216222_3689 [Pseudomonas prosekii]